MDVASASTKPGAFSRFKSFVGAEETKLKTAATGAFIGGLDLRIPTTTGHMSEVQKQEILSKIQPGDICLETNDAYPEWQRLEFLTSGSNHTHAFTYEGNGKMLQSTTPDGVQRTDLAEYLKGRVHVKVIRPDYKTPEDLKENLKYQSDQVGKPYNQAFDTNDTSSFYCFQLGSEGLKHMDHPIVVPTDDVAGKQVYSARSLENLPGAKVIVDDHASFWKSQLTHWPVAAGAIGIGSAVALGVGAVAGVTAAIAAAPLALAGGLALAICEGNKIQTGHFGFGGAASEEA